MKNLEIIKWLLSLDPETPEQEEAIKKAAVIFLNLDENKPNSNYGLMYDKTASEFLGSLSIENVVGKFAKDLYAEYVSFCDKNNYHPLTNLVFGKYVCMKFNVQTKSKKINGTVIRQYRHKNNT